MTSSWILSISLSRDLQRGYQQQWQPRNIHTPTIWMYIWERERERERGEGGGREGGGGRGSGSGSGREGEGEIITKIFVCDNGEKALADTHKINDKSYPMLIVTVVLLRFTCQYIITHWWYIRVNYARLYVYLDMHMWCWQLTLCVYTDISDIFSVHANVLLVRMCSCAIMRYISCIQYVMPLNKRFLILWYVMDACIFGIHLTCWPSVRHIFVQDPFY